MNRRQLSRRIERWQKRAASLQDDAYAILLAYKDPRTPWFAKVAAFVVVSYALSPLDLIPDFIPVLGYLDDLLLLPVGVFLAVKLIPKDVMADCRSLAKQRTAHGKRRGWYAALIVVTTWLLGLIIFWYFLQTLI